ncbi:LacI family DNA-binding transcriptional regulator [Nonomuraea sp. NEAU-A123]|uniref:LacI family DNA-binding transcriptional regulator n=1 Tax=Nonomuraea sp. NEAU-A123 TaxID=2839649 RepID=UPI001BE4D670|nr:LacI family DNA-binding transcriptional regulator [Nonomuraea sp. NEAU-A123]MBT2232909.1 LacI family transcriptional regulator [Nonomuraea sp. NEAU-A123]
MATEPGSSGSSKRSRPSLKDVAARAGVSRASASRVLGGYGYSSQEIVDRVTEAVRELGYEPDRIARTMRSGKSDVIGFVCADISDAFFSSAMRGICDVALREGSQVIAMNTDDQLSQEQQATRVLLSHKVDGIIITPVSVREHGHIDALTGAEVPVVSLDRQLSDIGIDSVVADNEAATAAAIDHLISQGHRRIAFLGSVQREEPPALRIGKVRASVVGPSRPSLDRVRGYLRALTAAGLPVDRGLIALVPHGEPERRLDAVAAMLALEHPPSALFTADSYMTKSAFSLLSKRDIPIPEQMSLLGFDDLEWTTLVRPQISVVVQSAYDMGRAAADRLFAQISGSSGAVRGQRTVIPARFLGRDSVRSLG